MSLFEKEKGEKYYSFETTKDQVVPTMFCG
jgi:hypothetical protein